MGQEKMFEIKTIPRCPKTILQCYQANEDLGVDFTGRFEVKTRDKTFSTSIYPFLQTDHLVDQLKARQNFDQSSNRTFTYDKFSYNVVRVFFDQLHQVTTNKVSLLDALELMVFCNHEGQIDQKSDFEIRLYEELKHQILKKDAKQLCFIWMYLRSCGPSGWNLNHIACSFLINRFCSNFLV